MSRYGRCIEVESIHSGKHPWYHQTCSICERMIATGRVVIAVQPAAYVRPQVYFHRSCMESVLETAPIDAYDSMVEEITLRERSGIGLLSWVRSNDVSDLPKI